MTKFLIIQKIAYIFASFCEGEWFLYLFSFRRKIIYKLEKNWIMFNFLSLYLPKKQERKKIDVTFSFKRSLQNTVQITKP